VAVAAAAQNPTPVTAAIDEKARRLADFFNGEVIDLDPGDVA
jgi:hypothetical protein